MYQAQGAPGLVRRPNIVWSPSIRGRQTIGKHLLNIRKRPYSETVCSKHVGVPKAQVPLVRHRPCGYFAKT